MRLRRLDQILSSYGYCSRSEARGWLRGGRVTVSGEVAEKPDAKADPAKVLIDGQAIEAPDGLLAIYHKPVGLVCSRDEREGPSIYGALPPRWSQRNPPVTSIGRLDKDTTGLLFITDIGDLVQRWTSPKHKVPKIYEVTVDHDLPAGIVELFAAGTLQLEEDDKPCLPAKLEIIGPREARLELVEGKFHQVKRMFGSQGCNVVRLHRSRFGDFDLTGLAEGEWCLIEPPSR
jgi:16S rRNA pseudouridine516 synthase